jgi:Tol biopolymer transport system component
MLALCGAVAVVRGVAEALPDGGQLAFVWAGHLRLLDSRSGLVLDLNSRVPEVIIDGLQWSPDGSRIAFIVPTTIDIGILELPALHFRNLTDTQNYNEWTFVWSPDSREIAYTRRLGNSSPTDVYRKTIDGQELHLFSSNRMIDDLIWSPDSTMLGSRYIMTSGVRYQLIALDGSGGYEVSEDAVPDWLRLDLTDDYSASPSIISWRPPRPR